MRINPSHGFVLCLLLLTGSKPALAQHETAADVFGGEQYFQNYCANCHGAAGNLIAGVDLGHGNFRQPYTDADLLNIVMLGIPGKAMPATPGMKREQAVEVVKYLRSRGQQKDAGAGGDATRGKALYLGKGQCRSCHRVGGEGSRLGPDLSRIGTLRTSAELATSLVDPQREIQPNNRFYAVTTKAGQHVSGRLLNHDAYSVQLLDTSEQLRSFMLSELKEHGFIDSPMPSLRTVFTAQELADLVQYLVTLRGDQP